MVGLAPNRVLCDCTFKPEDHLVSLRTRRYHQKHYPSRRSLRATLSSSPAPVISNKHTVTQLERQGDDNGDHMEDMGGDYSIAGDELLAPLRDFGSEVEDPNFEDNDDEDDNVSHSLDEEEEVEDVNEDDSSDDDMESSGEQIYDDIAEWEVDRLKALSMFSMPLEWEETLRYFCWKCHSNISDTSYDKLRGELAKSGIQIKSLRATRRYLQSTLGIRIREYHRCINNCMVFVGANLHRRRCAYCNTSRFLGDDDEMTIDNEFFADVESYSQFTPRAVYKYMPIIPRLKLLYANPVYAKKMRYPKTLKDNPWKNGIRDVWEGAAMKHWEAAGYFEDERTIALHFSTDGVQLFRNASLEVWPFLILILNLPPEERYIANNFFPLGLCPGPSQPKDLDSFLIPFIEELRMLNNGVPTYDSQTKSTFLLKAHLVLLSGDTPGISKLLHLSGHMAKYPCRACKLRGTAYKVAFKFKKGSKKGQTGEKMQYYYPLHPPDAACQHTPLSFCNDINNLPRRTPEGYIHDGEASSDDPRRAVESGVKGISPFSRLATISIPESAPFDVMHLVYLGFVRDVCALINGSFFKSADLNNHSGRMTKEDWECLGVDMSNIRAPVSWGRYPRNIEKHIKGFKAEELSNFLIHYLLPLSFNRVPDPTYKALQSLVLAVSLATSYQVTYDEILEIEKHFTLVAKWYYSTFYQGNYQRLPACKYTMHALLHLGHDVRNWGPASYFWQFPEERLCGILVNDVKSRVHGSENLTVLMHQHQLLTFATKFGIVAAELPLSIATFTAEEYGPLYSFLSPVRSQRYQLTNPQFKHLQQHYKTIHSIQSLGNPELVNMDSTVQLWHRCRVDKTIFHCADYQRKNSTRLNHLVCIEQTVDVNANYSYRSRPEHMTPLEFYAYVQFYCVHSFRGIPQMLMYSAYRKIEIHDGLVEDKGHHCYGFQDIRVLQHLCAKVTGHGGKVYFVDAPELMEERLREALLE